MTNITEWLDKSEKLSPWWRRTVFIIMILGFSVLISLTVKVQHDAPPIPEQVVGPQGKVLFTKKDILAGQSIFLKYGLMDNGSIWGHGAYLGPDFSAQYLHNLSTDISDFIAKKRYNKTFQNLGNDEQDMVNTLTRNLLKKNRFDPATLSLRYTEEEAESYQRQIKWWSNYFSSPKSNAGLPHHSLQAMEGRRPRPVVRDRLRFT